MQCLTNANCGGATSQCRTSTGTCVQCLSNANCSNPNPVCSASSTCGPCSSSLDCSAGTSCSAGSCLANPESCSNPETRTIVGTMLNFQADLRRATDDVSGSCSNASSSPELVYRIPLAAPADVTITIAKAPSETTTSDPLFYVRSGTCTGTELKCVDQTISNATETATFYGLPAGDLFLFVEAWAVSNAVLTDVSIVLAPPSSPPANDSCATATPLTFTSGSASASGSLILANNSNLSTDASPSCSSAAITSGRDVVYSFSLSAAQDVQVAVTPTGGTSFTPVVYLRKLADCASPLRPTELGCEVGTATGLSTRFLNLPAGDYALWVDATSAAEARFTLAATLLPPTLPPSNDTCTSPTPLTFSAGRVSAAGATLAAANDFSSALCASGGSGNDVVYSFSASGGQPVSIAVASLTSGWAPVVSMANSCPGTTELACGTGPAAGVAGALVTAPPAGATFAFIDGVSGGGLFRLEGREGAPPNDTCATATPLLLSIGTTDNSVMDHTKLANDDFNNLCGRVNAFAGKDLVYAFTAPATATVTLTLWADSTFDPGLAVLTGTCGATACLSSVDSAARGGTETLSFNATAGTTYYVVVDGYLYASNPPATEGFFRLEAR